jgi:glycosyltransferase involved in cell wall biosynthesis
MKICIFVRILWPGGVQSIAFGEAKSLSDRGHEVDLIFLRDSGRGIHPWSYWHPYKIIYSPEINKRLLHKLFWFITRIYAPERGEDSTVDLDLIKKFEKRRDRYDIIIYYDQQSAFYANLGKKIHGDKFIVNVMETWYKRNHLIERYVERRALKKASGVITIGDKNYKYLNEMKHKNVYLLYPGTEIIPDILGFHQRENRIISVTMWDRGRHPEIFLEIAKLLKSATIYLLGDWTDISFFNEYIEKIKSLALEDKIIVTGKITKQELDLNYRHAKILVRFGFDEFGPGMATLEAIGYGLPLIINNGIGMKDIIDAFGANPSIIVDQDDYKQISEAIVKLLNDEKEWNLKHKNALSLAQSMSWIEHGKRLEDIISEIIKGN